MAEKIRMALVGIGVMGKKYAQMILSGQVSNMILTGVVARNDAAREWINALMNQYEAKPVIYSDVEAMFADADNFDAVLIATPHKTHAEIAVRAFELGKHVMCDKPAGSTIAQAEMMTAASEKYNRIYGMMFHQRLYPKYNKIKEMLQNGELGTLNRIMLVNSRYFRTSYYHKSGSWRSSWNGEGGGALINQGAHVLDIWQWLFGMPEKIYADIPFGKYNDFMVDDEATVQMRYPDGLTAVCMLTTGEAVWQERLEITGSKGKLLLEDDTLHIWRYSKDSLEYMRTEETNSRENLESTKEVIEFEKSPEPYIEMLENFATAVINNDSSILVAPGFQGINQLMLTNGAYYSAWMDKSVELPLDAGMYEQAFSNACREEMNLLSYEK